MSITFVEMFFLIFSENQWQKYNQQQFQTTMKQKNHSVYYKYIQIKQSFSFQTESLLLKIIMLDNS